MYLKLPCRKIISLCTLDFLKETILHTQCLNQVDQIESNYNQARFTNLWCGGREFILTVPLSTQVNQDETNLNSSLPSDKQLSNFTCLGQVFLYFFLLFYM